ncbi:mastermind-like protein 3 [Protopterus annectens]|uniref:mastermind-like protein 3 n=1 Tax=Protopterus annectens TaxID=7888 RepID=UPI001CFA2BF5|nr:mastermind-like protein 3 [Protopterus annectens]
MGDFGAPTATNDPNPLCMTSGTAANLSGCGGAGNAGSLNIPRHSTVVERLKQRIESCRKHHVSCESRYQQAQLEQLALERRSTVNLHQRTLEQNAKKSASKQQNKQQQDAEAAFAGQRNNTLIALQETVKRKLEGARSPLNGEQQNGVCDSSFSPTTKRIRKDGPGLDATNCFPNNLPVPSVSPLHHLDIKPTLPLQNSGTHISGLDDADKNSGVSDLKVPINGSAELEEGFNLVQSKDMKQEPLGDCVCLDPSDSSLSNQNKLFSDINLNEQEWQELIDELTSAVPEVDMQDLFNEDFEEKKEPDFGRPTADTPLPQECLSIKSDSALSPFPHVPVGSPQVRPASSGPQFSNVSSASIISSVSSAPPAPVTPISPANYAIPSPQTPNQGQAQPQSRPGSGFMLNSVPGSGSTATPVSNADLSPAEQLKQMAAQQQQRAKLIQQKQQQQSQASSWSPVGPPSSPFGGTFNAEKPSSPMMYQQGFSNQNPVVPAVANNPQKPAVNNYLPPNHMTLMNPQADGLSQSTVNKQANVPSYGNTKRLSHFGAEHVGQRITPPMANAHKSPMMPYMTQPQQVVPPHQMSGQMVHLTEEHKRLLLMKQKGLLTQTMHFGAMPPHNQDQNPVGISRSAGSIQPSVAGPGAMAPLPGSSPVGSTYIRNQQQVQAAMMFMESEKPSLQQVQMLQKQQQLLREQRQQQQQQMVKQHMQQQQQPQQQQRNPFPVQQVTQFQVGSPQDLAAARNQAVLQNMRSSRIMVQNAGMISMGAVQNPATMPAAAGQTEMAMNPYNTAVTNQQAMYGMNTGMRQMLQHPNQSGMNVPHNPGHGPQQPTSTQDVGMPAGFTQSMLASAAMSQQHPQMKGTVGQSLPRAQAPRLPSMMGNATQGVQGWQQQSLQAIQGRTSGEMTSFNNNTAYLMSHGQPRTAKQHLPQTISQTVVDASGTVRNLNPAMVGQMMPSLSGQPRACQPRSLVMTAMTQSIPNMQAFNQAASQQMPGGSFVPGSQSQAYHRSISQDLCYSYGSQSAAGSFPGITESTDLADSIMKGGSADEWMQEFHELFGNQ